LARRQKRIERASILDEANNLKGKSANIVLRDKLVFFIHIEAIDEKTLVGRNQRQKKVSFDLKNIMEIIYDY